MQLLSIIQFALNSLINTITKKTLFYANQEEN